MIEECGKGGLRVVLANQNFDQGGPDIRRAAAGTTSHLIFQVRAKDAAEKIEELDGDLDEGTALAHPDPLGYIRRNNYDPQALELVDDLDALVERSAAVQEADARASRFATDVPFIRLDKANLERATNRTLVVVMEGREDRDGDRAARLFRSAVNAFFGDSQSTGAWYTTLVLELANILEQKPIPAPKQVDSLSPAQAKEQLRRRLTKLPRLHAYGKLQRNGEMFELPIAIDTPRNVTVTDAVAEKIARIRENMRAQKIVRPQEQIDSEILSRVAADDIPAAFARSGEAPMPEIEQPETSEIRPAKRRLSRRVERE
jgi:hypothetical protein